MAVGAGLLMAIIAAIAARRSHSMPFAFVVAGFFIYGAIALGLRAFIDARLRTLVWQHTQLGDHRVFCFMEATSLFFLTASNLVATLLTLGLFLPFAQIRMARYMSRAVFVVAGRGGIDDFAASEQQGASAVGDESVGMFDFDIAI